MTKLRGILVAAFGPLLAAAVPPSVAVQRVVVELRPDSAVAAYCSAWSTADRAARNSLLARVWDADGVYADPTPTLASGRAALSDTIATFHQRFPGARFRCSAPQVHHQAMRFTWELLGADGAVQAQGMDFGELAVDGRIRRIVGFFGAPPSVAP